MKLLEFTLNYLDEENCKAKFREFREREGIICRICGCKEYYWKGTKSVSNAKMPPSNRIIKCYGNVEV